MAKTKLLCNVRHDATHPRTHRCAGLVRFKTLILLANVHWDRMVGLGLGLAGGRGWAPGGEGGGPHGGAGSSLGEENSSAYVHHVTLLIILWRFM